MVMCMPMAVAVVPVKAVWLVGITGLLAPAVQRFALLTAAA